MAQIDYGKIVRRSWELTKKYKWLWVYGLLLASFGGNGFSGSGGGNSLNPRSLPKEVPKDLPEKTSYVLGAATNLLKDWFTHVPISTWISLGIGVFLVFSVFLIISVILKTWARGALIAGVNEADLNKEVTLTTTSPQGIKAIKSLILLGLISFGITQGTLLITAIIIGIGFVVFSFSPVVRTIWLTLSIICAVLTFIILVVLVTLTAIYAERLIVLKNHTPWQAWKKGLRLSKGNFLNTILMGTINMALGCAVGCGSLLASLIVLGIPFIILLVPLIANPKSVIVIPLVIGLSLHFLLFLYFHFLVQAVFTVFKFSNWNLFFKEIVSGEEKHD